MTSPSPQPILDELVVWATPAGHQDDLLVARAYFNEQAGEVFEDDRQLEQRMAAFLEYYVCDRVAPWLGKTPARARYEQALREEPPERAAAFRAWTETIHGLFEVRRLEKGRARVRHLYSGIDFDVTERRQIVGLAKGDVLEARLVPFAGDFHFSSSYCWHPRSAAALIRAEVRRRLDLAQGQKEQLLVWDCAQRALKADRYRQIAIEKIYDFTARKT
jgi:hypothetical protein